jgi:hypothetical protein
MAKSKKARIEEKKTKPTSIKGYSPIIEESSRGAPANSNLFGANRLKALNTTLARQRFQRVFMGQLGMFALSGLLVSVLASSNSLRFQLISALLLYFAIFLASLAVLVVKERKR